MYTDSIFVFKSSISFDDTASVRVLILLLFKMWLFIEKKGDHIVNQKMWAIYRTNEAELGAHTHTHRDTSSI